ncbi:hypothetical protein [Neisseria sicca]|nr:hypothetical protein [Neisseria sicca]
MSNFWGAVQPSDSGFQTTFLRHHILFRYNSRSNIRLKTVQTCP